MAVELPSAAAPVATISDPDRAIYVLVAHGFVCTIPRSGERYHAINASGTIVIIDDEGQARVLSEDPATISLIATIERGATM